jgi:hypothetical protein
MEEKLIDIEDVKSVFKRVGIEAEECNQCMRWTSPELEEPLTHRDTVLAELTPELQGFFHCMGYAYEEKDVDPFRMRALYETFWGTVRSLHNLPLNDLVVKEGKYIVAM